MISTVHASRIKKKRVLICVPKVEHAPSFSWCRPGAERSFYGQDFKPLIQLACSFCELMHYDWTYPREYQGFRPTSLGSNSHL